MSSLILVALALMWACLLVPMWLRRHDESAQDRSVDRFTTAMRRLSRRVESTTGRVVSAPRRGRDIATFSTHDPSAHSLRIEEARRSLAESARSRRLPRPETVRRPVRLKAPAGAAPRAGVRRAPAADPAASARPAAARPAPVAGRAALVRRRRRAMLALLGLLTVSLVGFGAGALPWIVPLLLAFGLAGYLVHLRGEARRAAAVQRRRREAARRRTGAPAARPTPVRAPAPVAPTAPTAPTAPAVPAAAGTEPASEVTQPISASAVAEAVAAAAAEGFADGLAKGGRWQPTPVPLPTYVTAPVAARRPQTPPPSVLEEEEFVSVVAQELDWDRAEIEIDDVAEDDVERIIGRRAVGD